MAALNKQDIKELATDELQEKIAEYRRDYQRMRFNHTVSPLDNPMTLKAMRRDIARLLTELNQRNQQTAGE